MRFGLVSSGAVRRLRGSSDTGVGNPGAIGSAHIDDPEQQRAGAGFGNAEGDYGAADAGEIDARINARDYRHPLKAKDPFRKSTWKPEWFSRAPVTKLGDRTTDPESDTGGPGVDAGYMARNRRGGA